MIPSHTYPDILFVHITLAGLFFLNKPGNYREVVKAVLGVPTSHTPRCPVPNISRSHSAFVTIITIIRPLLPEVHTSLRFPQFLCPFLFQDTVHLVITSL